MINKQILYIKYIKEHKSCETIAKEFDCSHSTIYRKLVKYGIPRRTYKELNQGKNHPMFGKKKTRCH